MRYSLCVLLVPGAPELRLSSATEDTISFSWTVSAGSVVDRYEVIWEIDDRPFVMFRDTVLPTSFNTYTVTGLMDYGNITLSIFVTAYNAAGSRTSPRLCVEANFAAENSCPRDQDKEDATCDKLNTAPIAWSVVAGFVTIAVALMLVALPFYCYKFKSKKNNNSEHVNT